MRREKGWNRWIGLGMAGVVLLGAAGCGSSDGVKLKNSTDVSVGTETDKKDSGEDDERLIDVAGGDATTTNDFRTNTADFAISLLQASVAEEEEGNSMMISPLSVLEALAMTANGADGETAEQMRSVLGGGQTIDELNENIRNWNAACPDTEEAKMKIANAIWFKAEKGTEESVVKEDFLQKNKEYYGAGLYASDFSEWTIADINRWVKEKTDGKIEKIIDTMPASALMCLVNAVSFEAEWEEQYEESDIIEKDFTMESGTEKMMEMMSLEENYFLEDTHAVGVRKPYKDGYSFVALLPEEGMSVRDYVDSMSGEHFLEVLGQEQEVDVTTLIPKFTSEYSTSLVKPLISMGMQDAFDEESADFSKMTETQAAISDVLHKTYIEVDEQGTKAAAATAVMIRETAMEIVEEKKEVILDRPFVYAIIEDETKLPVFIGTYEG